MQKGLVNLDASFGFNVLYEFIFYFFVQGLISSNGDNAGKFSEQKLHLPWTFRAKEFLVITVTDTEHIK